MADEPKDKNVIDFTKKLLNKIKGKKSKEDLEEERILKMADLADAIDLAIKLSVEEYKLPWSEVLAIVAHRLAKHIAMFSNKEKLYLVLDDIIRDYAKIIPEKSDV